MDTPTFLGVQPTDTPLRYEMSIAKRMCTPMSLRGGCRLATLVAAMEHATGRELLWASAQYAATAQPGELLEIELTFVASGKYTTQARAVARVGQREIVSASAALGERPLEHSGQGVTMPDVPRPEDYEPRNFGMPPDDWVHDHMEQRSIKLRASTDFDGTPGDGVTQHWARPRSIADVPDAATLSMFGDIMSGATSGALGVSGVGISLDNTLRVVRLVPTEWMLLDIGVHAVGRGVGHGLISTFAEDGTLLAVASQSCVVHPGLGCSTDARREWSAG